MEPEAINQQIKIIQGTSPEQDPYAHLVTIDTLGLPSKPLDKILQAAQVHNYLSDPPLVMDNLYPPLFMTEDFESVKKEILQRYGESIVGIEFLNMSCDFGGEALTIGDYQTNRVPMSCGYLITFKGKNGKPGKRAFGPMVASDLKLLFELRDVDGLAAEDLLKLQVGFGYRHLEAMKAELKREPEDRKYDAIYYSFPASKGFKEGKTNLILKALGAKLKKRKGKKSVVSVQFGKLSKKEVTVLRGIAEIHNQYFLKMVDGKDFTESKIAEKEYTVELANALIKRAGDFLH